MAMMKLYEIRRSPFCKTCFFYLADKKINYIIQRHAIKARQNNFLAPAFQETENKRVVYDALQFCHCLIS